MNLKRYCFLAVNLDHPDGETDGTMENYASQQVDTFDYMNLIQSKAVHPAEYFK